jgi:hypothetical protein
MYEASDEARNATTPAISSGCPKRFSGTFCSVPLAQSSITCCGSPVLPKIRVTMGPGATAFMRMLRSTKSAAAVRARERNAGKNKDDQFAKITRQNSVEHIIAFSSYRSFCWLSKMSHSSSKDSLANVFTLDPLPIRCI